MRSALRCCLLPTLLLAALSGCRGTPAPSVTVSSAHLVEVTSEGAELAVELTFFNPGRDPLPLDRVHYAVAVDGRRVWSGTRSPESTLTPGVERSVTLPVPVLWERAGWTPGSVPETFELSLTGRVGYLPLDVAGRVLRDLGWRRPTIAVPGAVTVGRPAADAGR